MRYRLKIVAPLLVLAISPSIFAASAVLHDLKLAEKDVKSKDYQRAIDKAKPLLDQLLLTSLEEILLAHRVLGVSYCELGDQTKALDHYKTLLTFSPTETVDDLVSTKPCTALFQEAKGGEVVPPQAATAAGAIPPPVTASVQSPPAWKMYMPFGVGQFANEQPAKGWAFLSTEVVAAGTATAGYLLFKGEEGPNGTYADPDKAAFYRGLYWGSIGVAAAAVVWGVVDAVVVRKKKRRSPTSAGVHFSGTQVALRF